jgi:hypothetical protein
MHIKKNMLKNIFNMIMNVKGKIKDNLKDRIDIALFCDRRNMKLFNDDVLQSLSHIFVRKKLHKFLYINGLKVCDFLMDMFRT